MCSQLTEGALETKRGSMYEVSDINKDRAIFMSLSGSSATLAIRRSIQFYLFEESPQSVLQFVKLTGICSILNFLWTVEGFELRMGDVLVDNRAKFSLSSRLVRIRLRGAVS